MSYNDFVNGVAGRRSNYEGGSDRMPLFTKEFGKPNSVAKAEYTFRFFMYEDNGIEMPGFNYFEHWVERRPSVCLPNTFRDDTIECERCMESDLCYSQNDKARGKDLAAKASTWFVVVPLVVRGMKVPKDKQIPMIFQTTGATAQKVLKVIAAVGGWTGEEFDASNPECMAAFEDGLPKCYGRKAKDITITYDQSKSFQHRYGAYASRTLGRVVNVEEDAVQNLREIFMRMKKKDISAQQGLDDYEPQQSQQRAPKKVAKKASPARKKAAKKVVKKTAAKKKAAKKAPARKARKTPSKRK